MIRSHAESVPVATARLLVEIGECRGQEKLFVRQSPHALSALRDAALVQSVESSNRIEGVEVDPKRLRPLVLGRARPADRSEAELQGYREALKLIHADAAKMHITPQLIRRVLRELQRAGRVECLGRGPGAEWSKKG